MSPEMRQTLTERPDLTEARATALLDTALRDGQPCTTALRLEPKNARQSATWRRLAVTIAVYRDRYGITEPGPLGPLCQRTTHRRTARSRPCGTGSSSGPRPMPDGRRRSPSAVLDRCGSADV
jgi:hypothetical protein